MSDAIPVKFVIIRTSTRSNIVFSDGHRENILTSIAITQDSTSLYQTVKEETSLYSIKETLQGVKSMRLELVDENGEHLFFRIPYEIKIAVFFK